MGQSLFGGHRGIYASAVKWWMGRSDRFHRFNPLFPNSIRVEMAKAITTNVKNSRSYREHVTFVPSP
ncbi:hypothetical protein OsccyDRAFT_3788 [Leptolyngbyaceae cyanobacterium JSC-12]|nr:hypothetical protein OsccyDRAFT_3788 [Leptolyngbyaceae cyanobacterium JSC-12]